MELKLTPQEAYSHLKNILEQVLMLLCRVHTADFVEGFFFPLFSILDLRESVIFYYFIAAINLVQQNHFFSSVITSSLILNIEIHSFLVRFEFYSECP